MPRCKVRWVLILTILIFIYVLLTQLMSRDIQQEGDNSSQEVPVSPPRAKPKSIEDIRRLLSPWTNWTFVEALEAVATADKVVILSMVDSSQVPSVTNFYETSIVPLGLSQTLFVSVSHGGCRQLLTLRIPCVVYGHLVDNAALYDTREFLDKMNVRTNYTLQALQLGYSILQTDTDVVYFTNPFPYLDCNSCHIEALEDGVQNYINAGFVFIRATKVTVAVYERMRQQAVINPGSEDQRNLNNIVKAMRVSYRVLNHNKFMCGLVYYEKPKRYFKSTAPPCPQCIVVHNNWIVSTEAKIYRFKEMGQWSVDTDGYYSSTSTKYITYKDNSGDRFKEVGWIALKNALALARMLNRTLILPRFQCDPKGELHCPLNNFMLIKHFDKQFCDYRESEFLRHKLVPNSVKSPDAHKTISFDTLGVESGHLAEERMKRNFRPNAPVVHLEGDLSRISVEFQSKQTQSEFNSRVARGFVFGDYKQLKADPITPSAAPGRVVFSVIFAAVTLTLVFLSVVCCGSGE